MRNRARIEPAVAEAQDRPVFIGGCPRSGTTLLSSMLHAHPALAIPPETRFFLESYRRRHQFGDLRRRENRQAFGVWLTRTTSFERLQLQPEALVAAIADAPPTLGSLCGTVFAEFAAAHGAARWGDKRPWYVEHLPVVFRLVPDAQFIHIIRDGRGCTASLKELGWWGWGTVEALHKWRTSIKAGLRARTRYRPDQYLELRYEDLVADPVPQLHRICAFLRIEFDDAMLAHQEGAALIKQPHHRRLFQPLDAEAAQSWRTRLSAEELALVQQRAGHLLDEFGYPRLSDVPAVPVQLRRAYNRYATRRALAGVRDAAVDVIAHLRSEPPLAAQLTSAQRRLAADG